MTIKKVVRGYCPVCEKIVPDSEVFAVVVEIYVDGTENINRAFHYPGCKAMGELEPRECEEASDD